MSQAKSKVSVGNKEGSPSDNGSSLLFGRKNYIYLSAGILLIFIGFFLMSGGQMPSPDVWDESIIYSFRRITLAPLVILSGLILSGFSIFVKK